MIKQYGRRGGGEQPLSGAGHWRMSKQRIVELVNNASADNGGRGESSARGGDVHSPVDQRHFNAVHHHVKEEIE